MTDFIYEHIHSYEHNPEAGAKLTVFHLFIGIVIGLVKDGHINPLIMDCLQAGAWMVAILVGAFTIWGYIKQHKNGLKNKDEETKTQP